MEMEKAAKLVHFPLQLLYLVTSKSLLSLILLCGIMWWNQWLIICTVVSITSGELIDYVRHIIEPDNPEYLLIPKFAKSDVPHWKPGKGRSYIDLSSLYVQSVCSPDPDGNPFPEPDSKDDCKTTTFDLLMFEAPKDKRWQDYWEDGNYCCSKELSDQGECPSNKINSLIVPSELEGALLRSVSVPPDAGLVNVVPEDHISKHDVSNSGVYVILMAECNPDVAPMVIHGTIDSMDPYGYLPADLFGDLPFYLSLCICYLIVGLTWLVLCIFYADQLMPLQMWISAVLVIGMVETSMLFAHYLNWNDNGRPALAITVIGLVCGVIKRALSRILVQLVALGYGVVRPSLGEDMNRVLYLGGAYLVCSLIYTLITGLPSSAKSVSEPEYDMLSLLTFALAAIDTTFYVWIFTSINNLMISLAARKQSVKYLLYRNFRGVLFAMLIFTCGWALYSSVFYLNDSGGGTSNWQDKWTIDALWELIYFVIFVAIAVLWAPSKNSQRYAFSIELTQLEDDEEYMQAGSQNALDGTRHNGDGELDGEYGGKLQDDQDPFQGTGALDPAMAMLKKA